MRIFPEDAWAVLCIFAESRGEPYEGQLAVACVIRNRMKAKIFSDGSVVSTVTWPYQFSWMNTTDKQRTRVLSATWAECIDQIRAWRESGERDITEGATHYHATYVKPDWAAEMKFIKRIGRHLFYRRES